MLVVKVEVWPGGSVEHTAEIARIGLANTSGLSAFSDYELTALMERDHHERVFRGEISAHERSLGWVPLVRRAVNNLCIGERIVTEVPYDDPVAEYLRKG